MKDLFSDLEKFVSDGSDFTIIKKPKDPIEKMMEDFYKQAEELRNFK